MKLRLYLMFACMSLLFSCRSDKHSERYYFNDMESVVGWDGNANNVVKGTAHSGYYASKLDSVNHFSYGLNIQLKEVSEKPIQKISISIWCLANNNSDMGQLVVEINSPDGKNIFWKSIPMEESKNPANVWNKISGEFDISKDGINDPGNRVKIYVWNGNNPGDRNIFVDDIGIEFHN